MFSLIHPFRHPLQLLHTPLSHCSPQHAITPILPYSFSLTLPDPSSHSPLDCRSHLSTPPNHLSHHSTATPLASPNQLSWIVPDSHAHLSCAVSPYPSISHYSGPTTRRSPFEPLRYHVESRRQQYCIPVNLPHGALFTPRLHSQPGFSHLATSTIQLEHRRFGLPLASPAPSGYYSSRELVRGGVLGHSVVGHATVRYSGCSLQRCMLTAAPLPT